MKPRRAEHCASLKSSGGVSIHTGSLRTALGGRVTDAGIAWTAEDAQGA